MLEGRKQARTREGLPVQIIAVHDSLKAELAMVQNVSLHGAQLATERPWEPGSHVILKSPTTGNSWARARVVYCEASQVQGSKEFAVGLDFLTQTSDWETRSNPSIVRPPK
jgi:hypothetical protein